MTQPAADRFDLAAHQRQRIRALERDNQHLEHVRRRLERILAVTLKVAAGQECDPLTLLAVIEELDKRVSPDISDERMIELLRLAA